MGLILAALVVLATLAFCIIGLFGSMMSDNPSASADVQGTVIWIFCVGMGVAFLLTLTHYFPLGW